MSQHPALPYLRLSEKGKVVTAAEAVRLIRDGDTVATGGFVGIGFAEEIAVALETLYLESEGDAPYAQGKPKNLTLVYAAGQGDGKERGLNHLGHRGLVRLVVRSQDDIAAIRAEIEKHLQPLGRRIYAIVNYDSFTILPDLIDAWTEMVKALVERHYWGVTRYATSGFLRAKLGESLARRGVAPHLYESAEEAHAYLQELERRTVP
jgi:hypothetical protein